MISHSSRDAEFANSVRGALEERGLKCWMAPRDLRPGESWADGIVRGIESASSVVLLVTRHINDSAHVLGEITQAVHLGKPIFPIVVDDVRLTRSLDYYLRPLHWIFVRSGELEVPAAELCSAINGSRDWRAFAQAPTLRRQIRHGDIRRVGAAFVGSLLAAGLVAGAGWFGWRGKLDGEATAQNADYRSMGWAQLNRASRPLQAGHQEKPPPWVVTGNVFLMGSSPRWSEVNLALGLERSGGQIEPVDISSQLDRQQVGHSADVRLRIARLAPTVHVCLTRPHPVLGIPYRVEQAYRTDSARAADGEEAVEFVAIGDPVLSSEVLKSCGTKLP